MQTCDSLLLQSLGAWLDGKGVDWDGELGEDIWAALFHKAEAHGILPMIFEAVYACPAAGKADPRLFSLYRQRVKQTVLLQTEKTDGLLRLLPRLADAGVQALVVKGILCRELYPKPDFRISGDEDLLLPPEQLAPCREILTAWGMVPEDPCPDPAASCLAFRQKDGPLRIELHTRLFPPESEAYGDFNRFFADAHSRAVIRHIRGGEVPTMDETDHLFYLLCHCLKHFLHGGFGIRQVCDICLFANAYGAEIDWQRVMALCRQIRGETFAAALLRIGREYLTLDPGRACLPEEWKHMEADENALLEDILDAGVFGGGSMSRRHSAGITLNAVAAEKTGRRAGCGVLKALFPPARDLARRYPYLRRNPRLLPLAWGERIVHYGQERPGGAGEALRIGSRRVKLLRQYGIIHEKTRR